MFKLELSEQTLSVIANALAVRPYQEVAQAVAELQRQIQSQPPRANGPEPMAPSPTPVN